MNECAHNRRERSRVLRSAGMVGGWTLGSRLLGMGRDILMAVFFGTSLQMSAFVIAFRIPNLFRRLFGEGALAAAFIPVFVETMEKEGREEAWAMAGRVGALLAVVLLAVVMLVEAGLSVAIGRVDPGGRALEVLVLLRIMFPYMLFICLAAMAMATLQALRHFLLPAVAPCMLNLLWMAAILAGAAVPGLPMDRHIRLIAWAVLAAGVVQWGMQLPLLFRLGYRLRLPKGWIDARVRRVLFLMGPAALGLAVTQVNVFIDSLLAIWIGPWAPAALFYSERLIYLPLGIFGTALGTVLLPAFSSQLARQDREGLRDTLNHALRNLLFVTLPAAAGLLLLAGPIVRLMFEWREFSADSTWLTAMALRFYAPGLVVFSLAKVFVPAFYALQDMRTPVRIGLRTVALNLALNLLFVLTFPLRYKHAGLALATVLAEGVYAVTLAVLFHRRLGSPGWRSIAAGAGKALAACAVMACACLFTYRFLTGLPALDTLPTVLGRGILVFGPIAAAIPAYLLATLLFRSREPREILLAARGREIEIEKSPPA